MKLTLTQPDLNHALRTVSRAVASGRTHPVLAHVLLTTGNGNLQVSAYDLDLGITTPAPAIIDTAGSITIAYRLLADIIGRLEATDVVTLAATGTDVTVTTLSGSYKLSGGPAEDFPALPAVAVDQAASVAFEAAVLPASSTDEAKQILTGIHLRIAGGVMTQEATDGHRLAVRSCAIDAPDMDIVIPARSIRRIDGNVLLTIDNHQAAMVTADGTTIISRTLGRHLPQHPAAHPHQLHPYPCLQPHPAPARHRACLRHW
jgi:DNA polymerase III subunit beta